MSALNEVMAAVTRGDQLYSEAICTDTPTVPVPVRGDGQQCPFLHCCEVAKLRKEFRTHVLFPDQA